MSITSNYTFFNMSSIGEDDSYIEQRSIQNTSACDYTLQNFFSKDCSMRQTKQIAVSQPGVNYSGTKHLCPGGGNVYESNKLIYGDGSRKMACKSELMPRPYATVPCLKRGYGDVVLEAELQQGERSSMRKIYNDTDASNLSLSEINYSEYNASTLIPDKQNVVQNPKNLVEERASSDWVRGGISSRNSSKDTNQYVSM